MMYRNSHRPIGLALILAAMLVGFVGCNDSVDGPNDEGPNNEAPQAGDVLRSDKARDTSPDVSDPDLIALVEGNRAFTADLYQALAVGEEGNLFFSPHSISVALAMTFAGAEGETETEMAEALHFTLQESELHPAFNLLDLELNSRGQTVAEEGRNFELSIVNALWGQFDYTFLDGFLDLLALNYGAGMNLVDYVGATEQARQIINDWVADATEDRIPELLGPNAVSELTRLVLTNAIYFKAGWTLVFDEELTHDGTFHCLDGNDVTVPMMTLSDSMSFVDGENFQAVELLYEGEEMSMVLVLPDEGELESFEAGLSAEIIDEIFSGLEMTGVSLTMPRFQFDSEFELSEVLSALGMPTAFTSLANFSGMDGTRNLFISKVIHKAFVAVDEYGTEAAAATAVVMDFGSVPSQLTLDRPFLFFIRDIQTGSVLFMGRVGNPAA